MIAGRRKDLNELKREAISHSTIKITRNFKKIVQSKEFDSFLTSGAHYSLWFARTLHLERLSSGNALMSAHADSMAARNKTPIFGDVTCSLDECRRHKAKFLQEFARSYCFLLLHISRNSVEPAKERAYFENIYIFTQKIVVALIEFPAFSSLVEAELNRMFRSELFCGVDSLIDDPVGMMKSGHLLQLRSGGAAGGLSGAATAAVDSSGTASMKVGLAAGAGAGGESSGVVTRDAWMTVPAAGAAGIGSRPFSSTSARPESSRPTHGGGYARRPSGGGSTSVRPNSSSTTGSPPEPVRLRTRKSVGVGGEPGRASQLSRPVPLQRIVQAREEQQQHHDGAEDSAVQPAQDEGQANDSAEPDSESILVPASKVVKKTRRKRISLNDVRMARSPLADAILPPPQRFLFVQTHARF
ncbi:hypothetical protein DFJ73DRAFT_855066 [Zopfochytrium polystomum]|nr:hypothetical protein DFJ73DRAFT_855066 [Zopfochytrium polystomum]